MAMQKPSGRLGSSSSSGLGDPEFEQMFRETQTEYIKKVWEDFLFSMNPLSYQKPKWSQIPVPYDIHFNVFQSLFKTDIGSYAKSIKDVFPPNLQDNSQAEPDELSYQLYLVRFKNIDSTSFSKFRFNLKNLLQQQNGRETIIRMLTQIRSAFPQSQSQSPTNVKPSYFQSFKGMFSKNYNAGNQYTSTASQSQSQSQSPINIDTIISSLQQPNSDDVDQLVEDIVGVAFQFRNEYTPQLTRQQRWINKFSGFTDKDAMNTLTYGRMMGSGGRKTRRHRTNKKHRKKTNRKHRKSRKVRV
jgi:hypothetical protein